MASKKYFEFKNIKDDVAEVYLYGEITSNKEVETDVSAIDFKNELDNIGNKTLNIYINSPGGNIMEGMAISSMIKRYKGETNAYIDGVGASIASVIALSADNVYMPSNAYLMIHNAMVATYGNSKDLRAVAITLEKLNDGIIEVYKAKSKVDSEVIKSLMNNETWLTGSDTAQYFNINVIEENKAVACITEDNNFKNMPKALLKVEPIKKNDDKQENEELEILKIKLKY